MLKAQIETVVALSPQRLASCRKTCQVVQTQQAGHLRSIDDHVAPCGGAITQSSCDSRLACCHSHVCGSVELRAKKPSRPSTGKLRLLAAIIWQQFSLLGNRQHEVWERVGGVPS